MYWNFLKGNSTVHEIFPEKMISLRSDVNWPSRSSDLTSVNFFQYLIKDVQAISLDRLKENFQTLLSDTAILLTSKAILPLCNLFIELKKILSTFPCFKGYKYSIGETQ